MKLINGAPILQMIIAVAALATVLPSVLAELPRPAGPESQPGGDAQDEWLVPAPKLRGLAGTLSAAVCNVVPQVQALRLNISRDSGILTSSIPFGSCVEISGLAEGGAAAQVLAGDVVVADRQGLGFFPSQRNFVLIQPTKETAGSDMFGVEAVSVNTQPTPFSWQFVLHNRCIQGSVVQWIAAMWPLPQAQTTNVNFRESAAQGMPVENYGQKPKYSFAIDDASPTLVYGEQGIANEATLIVCAGIMGNTGEFKPHFITAGDKGPLMSGAASTAVATAGWLMILGASALLSRRGVP